jgi:acyl-CoA synthetase (NDP forming)
MSSLDHFFNPRSVALIGASRSGTKLGGIILKNLLQFRGKVYPVNPKHADLLGLAAYRGISDIPDKFDLAVIIRPAAELPDILKELAGRTKGAVIMSSGFAEVGEVELQNEVKRIGHETGIRIVGPNCMGLYNPSKKLDIFFLPQHMLKRPGKGNVAILSQSGAILSCLLAVTRSSRAGVSKVVGYGNAIDIDEADIYEYLAEDKETEVVVSYIESVRDGRKFLDQARKLSEQKQLIVLKSGKGESGKAAAFSHTGRLAGRYDIFRSLLRRFGIREAVDFDGLMDATKALSFQKVLKGKRICIITNGGGSGVLAADECMRQDLEVPALSSAAREKVAKVFPNFYGVNNPVDLTAQVKDADYDFVLNELKEEYDGFLLIALPNVPGITLRLAEVVKAARQSLQKPLVCHIAEGGLSLKLTKLIERARVPVYPSPERAVRALKALLT